MLQICLLTDIYKQQGLNQGHFLVINTTRLQLDLKPFISQ